MGIMKHFLQLRGEGGRASKEEIVASLNLGPHLEKASRKNRQRGGWTRNAALPRGMRGLEGVYSRPDGTRIGVGVGQTKKTM